MTRFIPACAGNSSMQILSNSFLSVHPRLRGELKNIARYIYTNYGSSPLARGTLYIACILFAVCRFIPACAGNSAKAEESFDMNSVHPRLRGELGVKMGNGRITSGSSPLARGTHFPMSHLRAMVRFIPACAGNSFPRNMLDVWQPVHPRLRGELIITQKIWFLTRGSSPLARGTLTLLTQKGMAERFIPACAGNSVTY